MPEPNLFQIFAAPLQKIGIRYMVTGATAAIIYGEPRVTHDIDLVIELKPEDINELQSVFPPEEFYCAPYENIRLEIQRRSRGHFNIIHRETGFKADCYLMGQDELHRWAMPNRREIKVEGESIWVAPPEYVILRKLEYYREGGSEKHLRDISGMLTISPYQIDFKQLEEKIRIYGLQTEWVKAKKMAEE